MPCNPRCQKLLFDCQGELLEAVHNVPLAAVNEGLSDKAMEKFSEMTTGWAGEYLEWKAEHIHFNDNGDDDHD